MRDRTLQGKRQGRVLIIFFAVNDTKSEFSFSGLMVEFVAAFGVSNREP